MNSARSRSALIGIVGAYLLYTAYDLFKGRENPDTTMTRSAMILFIALFVVSGILLLVYAVRLWKAGEKEAEDNRDSENRMK